MIKARLPRQFAAHGRFSAVRTAIRKDEHASGDRAA